MKGSFSVNKILAMFLLLIVNAKTFAFQCEGTITEVLGDTLQCNGHFALRISENENYWICSDSDKSDSLILTAFATGLTVQADVPGSGTCIADLYSQALTQSIIVLSAVEAAPAPTYSATGGSITYGGGYTVHTFTESGTFISYGEQEVEVLVVAGGGSGGNDQGGGGGGGGGGVIYDDAYTVYEQSYSITVGGGGQAQTSGPYLPGFAGDNSSFGGLIAYGGGAGGVYATSGGTGGSGGGGGYGPGSTPGNGSGNQGYSGGDGSGVGGVGKETGGGGGGAAGTGTDGVFNYAGNGGPGAAYNISGITVYYGGGGGGGTNSNASTVGTGGIGGGGDGGKRVATHGENGEANTGGGGGGGGDSGTNGGAGGSGIVIIRYHTN
jgi:hypothetical protein